MIFTDVIARLRIVWGKIFEEEVLYEGLNG
jgi:hypothetical protein